MPIRQGCRIDRLKQDVFTSTCGTGAGVSEKYAERRHFISAFSKDSGTVDIKDLRTALILV